MHKAVKIALSMSCHNCVCAMSVTTYHHLHMNKIVLTASISTISLLLHSQKDTTEVNGICSMLGKRNTNPKRHLTQDQILKTCGGHAKKTTKN